jgi:hypothetical protein
MSMNMSIIVLSWLAVVIKKESFSVVCKELSIHAFVLFIVAS